MPWAAGPDDFHLDPRAFEAGAEAVGLFSMVRAWISQALTDGRVPRGTALGYARALGIADPDAAFARLVDTGLWARSGSTDFADVRYLENNPSRARVEEKKALTKKRQADWKERNKGKKMSDTNASPSHNNASLTRDSRVTNAATQTPAQTQTQTRSQNARATPARTPVGPHAPAHGAAGREGGEGNPSHEPEPQTLPADARAPLAGPDGTTPGGLNVQTTKRPVNGRVGARPRAAAPPPVAAAPSPDHAPAADAPEDISKARQIEINHARYAAHYSAGVAAATGGAHEVATAYERGVLAALLGQHARDLSGGKLKGPELDAWLRAEGEAFARATMATRHMQRGFSPSKFGEWLNAGRPGATPTNGSGPSGTKAWARLA